MDKLTEEKQTYKQNEKQQHYRGFVAPWADEEEEIRTREQLCVWCQLHFPDNVSGCSFKRWALTKRNRRTAQAT